MAEMTEAASAEDIVQWRFSSLEGLGSDARDGAAVGGSILPATHLALASDAALDMKSP
jgi:hypothetical protein